MRLVDFYPDVSANNGGAATADTQDVSSPASAARSTSPQSQSQAAPMPHAAAISWVGILIALILLRVVYELSE